MSTSPALATPPRPRLYTVGEGHYYLDADADKCMIEVSQVRRDRNGELRGTLDVRTALAGALVLDDQGTINRYEGVYLMSPQRRREIALDLARRAKTKTTDLDWQSLLDDLAFQVGKAEATGEAAVMLADIPRPSLDSAYNVDGFSLLKLHPQILFGDGGALKSFTMLHFAGELARQGVRPMYCDWELDGSDHRERAASLWGDQIPSIVYVRCYRPLGAEIDRLARLKHEHQINFAFIDSIAFACHGKPEDAEVASAYYRAVRSLGIGTLHAAHITKSGDFADQRPFGSAFWHNGARATWFAKAEDESADTGQSRTVALINRKANLSARRPALAYRFVFGPGSVRIARADPASVASIASALPVWQRIKAAVSSGPLSFAEIAEETGIKEGTIRQTVNRKKNGMFTVIEGSNGLQKVALLETRRAS